MRLRTSHLFYLLVFLSAILSAVTSGGIAILNRELISDPWVLGMMFFLVGLIVTFGMGVFFSLPMGNTCMGARLVDPSFTHLRVITKREVKYHVAAGMGNVLYTLSYCALFGILGDPSVIVPFVQVVILYFVVIESCTHKNMPTLVEVQSAVIVTIGAILGSMSLAGGLDLGALVIVFLCLNPGWVLLSLYNRRLKRMIIGQKHNDSITIRFWNLVFSLLFATIAFALLDMAGGTSILWGAIRVTVTYFQYLVPFALTAFFSYLFYIRALGLGKASVTQALRSSTIVFAIPVSVLVASLGYIPFFSLDPVNILIKLFGILLIVLGIASFGLTQIKGFLFVKLKKGYPVSGAMEKLWGLRGVSRVSATTGSYDVIVEVRTRALYKGYEWIIRGIDSIPSIKQYQWLSILKEWENI